MKRSKSPRTIPGTTEDILSYLTNHGVQDKDLQPPRARVFGKPQIKKGKGGIPRMTIDLHGKTAEEASRSLRAMVETCREHGVKELLVIHGKGHHSNMNEGPVLKNMVRAMLENELRLRVKQFRTAPSREGGDGATLVFLV
ncbi:MAG: Smr/MutS family protein [Chitinispirillaceae bacterium]|nr:Smr/MutS family protein [Chitinispirillaceae bacterium]